MAADHPVVDQFGVMCPPDLVAPQDLAVVLAGSQGVAGFFYGRGTQLYSLDEGSVIALGLMPAQVEFALDHFWVEIDTASGSIIELDLAMSGPTQSFEGLPGVELGDGPVIQVGLTLSREALNDPSIEVSEP